MWEAISKKRHERLTVVAPLPSPEELRREFPVPPRASATVQTARRALRDVLHGQDDHRLAVIVGPCSIHDPAAALEYAGRLRQLGQSLAGELLVLMRVFVEKPRTSLGWKGLLTDPDLDGSGDMARGLRMARTLLRDVNALGVPCASELLNPLAPHYLGDLLAWGGIGARTVESQVHREIASSMAFPVGLKNRTDGDLESACNALRSATQPHRFLSIAPDGRPAVMSSMGNPDVHLVLRGGHAGPNHDAPQLALAMAKAAEVGVARPLVVDCSHGNSAGHPRRQASVCREVLDQLRAGNRSIAGLMLESHLQEGRQVLEPRKPISPEVSVTDACLGWNETADLLCEAAEAVKLSS